MPGGIETPRRQRLHTLRLTRDSECWVVPQAPTTFIAGILCLPVALEGRRIDVMISPLHLVRVSGDRLGLLAVAALLLALVRLLHALVHLGVHLKPQGLLREQAFHGGDASNVGGRPLLQRLRVDRATGEHQVALVISWLGIALHLGHSLLRSQHRSLHTHGALLVPTQEEQPARVHQEEAHQAATHGIAHTGNRVLAIGLIADLLE
mmetsp:Transcript_45840/g.147213  ORF Transcript_45840/g.147213 Transcript_45840/m.147213 type:complete len:207 (-) Transcript_45840:165-785(-)